MSLFIPSKLTPNPAFCQMTFTYISPLVLSCLLEYFVCSLKKLSPPSNHTNFYHQLKPPHPATHLTTHIQDVSTSRPYSGPAPDAPCPLEAGSQQPPSTSVPAGYVLPSRLPTGSFPFPLIVLTELMCVTGEKPPKESHVLRTSFSVHRPVWITAAGGLYTSMAAVYLTMRYMRRVAR